MAGRDLSHEAAAADFRGDRLAVPLADGHLRACGDLTGEGDELTPLLGGDAGRNPGPGQVRQARLDRQLAEREMLIVQPTPPPEPSRIQADAELASDLAVIETFCRRQDDARPQREWLGSVAAVDQLFQRQAFFIGEVDEQRLGATGALRNRHGESLLRGMAHYPPRSLAR